MENMEMERDFMKFMELNDFNKVKINFATPDEIRRWSSGEVVSIDTINFKTGLQEYGGLFCPRIFGPVKDYQCACSKYKGTKYSGHVCENCGVEVTSSSVRNKRMGHIDLVCPVSHVWATHTRPCLLYTSPSPRDRQKSRMPSSA